MKTATKITVKKIIKTKTNRVFSPSSDIERSVSEPKSM